MIFETERLIVTRLTTADVPFITELTNTEGWMKNIGDRGTKTEKGALAYLERGPLTSYERTGYGLWRVSLKDGDIPIGMCGIFKRDIFDHPDIGYAILPAFEGKGYISEAAVGTKKYTTEAFGQTNLIGITEPENEASIRVLMKLGMQFRKIFTLPGEDHELNLYSLAPL